MILLSGYDEFTFAKEAFKYGVFDYLLKPTVVDEVKIVITNAVKTIEQKRDKEKNYEYLENALQESIPIIEQSLLYDITVKGIVPTQNIKQSIDLMPGKGKRNVKQPYKILRVWTSLQMKIHHPLLVKLPEAGRSCTCTLLITGNPIYPI